MHDTVATDLDTFFRMTREFPIRTGIFTFGLPIFALLQLINGLIHGGSMVFIASFGVLAIACSILLTQYQLAVYRRERLTQQWL